MLPALIKTKKIGIIWAVLPRLSFVHQKGRVVSGWLIDRYGYLKAVYGRSQASPALNNVLLLICRGSVASSYTDGVRYQSTARLTGVLNYFTRGPDQEYFETSPQKI